MAEQHTPCTESLNVWRRRGFLRAAAVLAATGVSPRGLTSPTLTPTDDTPNFASRHITRNHPDYEQWRTAMPWQLYKAPRYPEAIVRPHYPEEVPDIVDLLPESSFGLNKSWDQLRKEFKKSVNRDGFKSWLKMEYGVSISIKTVSKALHQLDAIEGELHRISSELEIVASLSPLDAQL